jgi:hypothetical protein
MPRNAVLVDITPEDERWAVVSNQHNCLIVRAIQRKIPEAIYVRADEKTIAFSLPDDTTGGPEGTRYTFKTPPEVVNHVIKPFDQGEPIDEEWRTFTLKDAVDAKPMQHRDRRIAGRNQRRRNPRQARDRSQNAAVSSYNRFIDTEALMAGDK